MMLGLPFPSHKYASCLKVILHFQASEGMLHIGSQPGRHMSYDQVMHLRRQIHILDAHKEDWPVSLLSTCQCLDLKASRLQLWVEPHSRGQMLRFLWLCCAT